MAVLQHHALSKASSGVVVTQARERLDGVEIELFFLDDLLERKIKADGTLVDDIFLRSSAEELFQTRMKIEDFLVRNFLRCADEFSGIARVDIHSEHSHPLGRIGNSAGLTHAAAAEGPHGR